MDKQFEAENPLTLTLKGKDFLDSVNKEFFHPCHPERSRRKGWGKEKFGFFTIIHSH